MPESFNLCVWRQVSVNTIMNRATQNIICTFLHHFKSENKKSIGFFQNCPPWRLLLLSCCFSSLVSCPRMMLPSWVRSGTSSAAPWSRSATRHCKRSPTLESDFSAMWLQPPQASCRRQDKVCLNTYYIYYWYVLHILYKAFIEYICIQLRSFFAWKKHLKWFLAPNDFQMISLWDQRSFPQLLLPLKKKLFGLLKKLVRMRIDTDSACMLFLLTLSDFFCYQTN